MNRWIRLHQNALHNPKIVTLSDRQYRAWTNCLLMAAADDGKLPSIRDIACHLRMSVQDAELMISELVEVELVDVDVMSGIRTFRMHDWQEHQYISDTSTERVRKFRNKNKCNGDETFQKPLHGVSVTPPESYSDTDTEPNGLSSFPTAARKRAKEDQKVLKNVLGMKDDKRERLHRRAEGLGLNVEELVATCNAKKDLKSRTGYFTALCVDRLQKQIKGLEEPVIRAALWDADDGPNSAFQQINRMLVGAA